MTKPRRKPDRDKADQDRPRSTDAGRPDSRWVVRGETPDSADTAADDDED